jgi:hypothetical protein
MTDHPSRLRLDALALGAQDAQAATHADGCAECSAHLNAVKVQLPVPRWVGEIEAAPRTRGIWRLVFAAVAMMIVAVIGVLATPRAPAVQAKGAPDVQVWVNHAGHVAVWDGKTPLQPGDSVRFDIASAGYSHLTVAELQDGRVYQVLHSADVGPREATPAWSVDDQGSREEIGVVLSNGPLGDAALQAGLQGQGGVWSKSWVFPKESPK